MKGKDMRRTVSRGQTLRFVVLVFVALATGSACLSRPVQPIDVHVTTNVVEKLTRSGVTKIDLLLAIDNSRSMADKEQILNTAVPDLVDRLVNPICVDGAGAPLAGTPPAAGCPTGYSREFPPILDIHIGVVNSSLGSHGGNECPDVVNPSKDCPSETGGNPDNNDHGHLITRSDPCNNQTAFVPTYKSEGFLAWDLTSPEEYTTPGLMVANVLKMDVMNIVSGNGQVGCGFESQEEGWFRFLVDPAPYQSITVTPDPTSNTSPLAVKTDVDTELLMERAHFLRSDSLLAIIVLTDENDGSEIEGGQNYLVENNAHLHPPRAVCATNPNDPCCFSCGQSDVAACTPKASDPSCAIPLDDVSDHINQRMFDEKRRFGIDFLYPWRRYVNGLTQPKINPANLDYSVSASGTDGIANPIYSDLSNSGNPVRDPSLVFLAGISGVVWQDIAVHGDVKQGFKNASQLKDLALPAGTVLSDGTVLPDGATTWDIILGDPDNYKKPLDPHMIEQMGPRSGTNPLTGTPIAQATAPNGTDPINGHEFTSKPAGYDLQYACIFTLPNTRDCHINTTSCDCTADAAPDNPLCEPNPADPTPNNRTLQVRAKAYPGVRELQILKGMGQQGIVTSVCPVRLDDTTQPDYGYRPAVAAIIDRLKSKLNAQCLPFTLTVPTKGPTADQAPCVVIAARKRQAGTKECDSTLARIPVDPSHLQAEAEAAQDIENPANAPWDSFCEVPQTRVGAPLTACQNITDDPLVDKDGNAVDGWCYVDGTTVPPTGNKALLDKCDANDEREIRLVGHGHQTPGEVLFIDCSNSSD